MLITCGKVNKFFHVLLKRLFIGRKRLFYKGYRYFIFLNIKNIILTICVENFSKSFFWKAMNWETKWFWVEKAHKKTEFFIKKIKKWHPKSIYSGCHLRKFFEILNQATNSVFRVWIKTSNNFLIQAYSRQSSFFSVPSVLKYR